MRLTVQGNSHRRKHFKSGVYCGSIESNFLRALHALDTNRRIHADFTLRFFPELCQLVRSTDKAASVIPCFRSAMSVINCHTTTETFNSLHKTSRTVLGLVAHGQERHMSVIPYESSTAVVWYNSGVTEAEDKM